MVKMRCKTIITSLSAAHFFLYQNHQQYELLKSVKFCCDKDIGGGTIRRECKKQISWTLGDEKWVGFYLRRQSWNVPLLRLGVCWRTPAND